MKIDRTLAGWAVGLVLILAAFGLGVLALTPIDQRGDLIRQAAAPLGGLVAAVGGLIAAKSARATQKETAAQTPTIERIEKQTNGVLTGRIQAAVNAALEARGVGDPLPGDVLTAPDYADTSALGVSDEHGQPLGLVDPGSLIGRG